MRVLWIVQGLEINAQDAWSTHSLAHVLEMTGRSKEGIQFMSTTVNDWAVRLDLGLGASIRCSGDLNVMS